MEEEQAVGANCGVTCHATPLRPHTPPFQQPRWRFVFPLARISTPSPRVDESVAPFGMFDSDLNAADVHTAMVATGGVTSPTSQRAEVVLLLELLRVAAHATTDSTSSTSNSASASNAYASTTLDGSGGSNVPVSAALVGAARSVPAQDPRDDITSAERAQIVRILAEHAHAQLVGLRRCKPAWRPDGVTAQLLFLYVAQRSRVAVLACTAATTLAWLLGAAP